MWRIQSYFKMLIPVFALLLTVGLSAQTIDDAKSLYNEGGTALQDGDAELAVQKFAECVSICETLYEEEEDLEAEELLNNIKPTLPKLYLQVSQTKAKDRDLNSSLEYAAKAKTAARQMGDDETEAKAADLASKIYYAYALSKYKAENYDGAVVDLSSAIEEDPMNFKAHYLLVVIYKTTENEPELLAEAKKLVLLDDRDDNRDKAITLAANYFYNKAVTAKQASNYDTALESVKSSLEINKENADAYFLLLSIYNSQQDWANAISAGNEGLKYESAANQARFNFELGNAYFGNGDNDAACEAFSKAAVGEYLENATYQMEHVVKCTE